MNIYSTRWEYDAEAVSENEDGPILLPLQEIVYEGRSTVVSAFLGDDGAIVVQIDTDLEPGDRPGPQHVRVNLNDAVLFDGDPESEN
jgi:hypothetical protein